MNPKIQVPDFFLVLRDVKTLGVRVRQQSLFAHLTTEPAIFEAGEVSTKVGSLALVDPDTAGLQTAGNTLSLLKVGRVNRRPEPCVGEVGTLDYIVLIRPRENRKDRA